MSTSPLILSFGGVRLFSVRRGQSITHPAVLEQMAGGHWSDYLEGKQKKIIFE